MENIFNSESNHLQWATQREYLNNLETINESIRDNAIDALHFLEQELGRNFLKTYSVNHPVRQKISEKTKWQIVELIEFTNTLKALKSSDSNYKKLVQKLLSHSNRSTEGITFVEIAKMYFQEQFDISFIEEDKTKDNKTKTPDVKVINPNNGDVFYIELTTLGKSGDQNQISNNYDFFHKQFNEVQPLFSFYGEQTNTIDENDYPEIREIIKSVRNRVEKNSQTIYYSDNRFNFLLAPPSESNFNKICKLNNIRPIHFVGLKYNFDETSRINSRIIKAKQIPQNYNGLLYFSVSPLYFMTTDMCKAINRLTANIAKYKNLLGIVLYSKIVGLGENKVIKFDNHLFARRTIDNLCQESLFIYNKNCDMLLAEETIQKIYKTLI